MILHVDMDAFYASVGVSKLDDSGTSQQQLFDQPDRARHRELDRVADQITAKFGKLAIRRGTGLKPGEE